MNQSFYQYLMTERHSLEPDDITRFAHDAELDDNFPKRSEDYHEISQYLEMNGHYLPSMTVFDEAWETYKEKNEPL